MRLAERTAIGSICFLENEGCCLSLWPIDPEVSSGSEESLLGWASLCNLQLSAHSVKAAYSINPVRAIRSELHLTELTNGSMSAAAAGNKVVIQLAERSWAVDLSAREAECVHAGMCCMFTWWRRALAPWGITAKGPCKYHVQYTVLVWGKAEQRRPAVLDILSKSSPLVWHQLPLL